MNKLYLRTPYGNEYHIHANGDIQRLDQYPADKPFKDKSSSKWKLLGIEHVKHNEFIPLKDLLSGAIPKALLYKNGNPQFTVRDLDCGSRRVWGNTKYHGIKVLRAV